MTPAEAAERYRLRYGALSAAEHERVEAIAALLEVLPDVLESAAAAGRPVCLPDPGTEHGRALYRVLGVRPA